MGFIKKLFNSRSISAQEACLEKQLSQESEITEDDNIVLLFLRHPLEQMLNTDIDKITEISTSIIVTPFGPVSNDGTYNYPLDIYYLNSNGEVGVGKVGFGYLNMFLQQYADKTDITYDELLDGSREFLMAGTINDDSYITLLYLAGEKHTDDMENMQRLESSVVFSIEEKLNQLPEDIKNSWLTDYVLPALQHIRDKLAKQVSEK